MADNVTFKDAAGATQTHAAKEDSLLIKHPVALIEFTPLSGDPVRAGTANPLPMTPATPNAVVNRSSTITTGSTAQTLLAAAATRRGFLIRNDSVADLFINLISTATVASGSLKLTAGSYYETPAAVPAVAAVSIIGATTGQAFTCWEW